MKLTLWILAIGMILNSFSIGLIVYVNGVQTQGWVMHQHAIYCLEQGKVWAFDDFCKDKPV